MTTKDASGQPPTAPDSAAQNQSQNQNTDTPAKVRRKLPSPDRTKAFDSGEGSNPTEKNQ